MKKIIAVLLILALSMSLAACGNTADSESNPSSSTPSASAPENNTASTVPQGETLDMLPSEMPQKFVLTTKSGVWKTEITLKHDGAFTGKFTEKIAEYSEEFGYPNGKIMVCDFTGKFANFIKVDEYTIAMKLDKVDAAYATEEFWIEDGIWYETTAPIGIENGEWFYIYLPGKPTSDLDKAFTMWYINSDTIPDKLDVYGLYNASARYAFFG